MPIGNLIVIGAIVAVFVAFIVALCGVTLWSEQTPKPKRRNVQAKPATEIHTA